MASGKKLSAVHPLYPNIVRALSGDLVTCQMRDLIGSTDTPVQTGGVVVADPVPFTTTWTAIQGIARNSTNWFAIDTFAIRRYDLTGALLNTNSTPFTGLPSGLNHCGDGFADENYLYIAIAQWVSATQTAPKKVIAKYNVSDLSLHSFFDLSALPEDFSASGVCPSPDNSELWVVSYNTTDADSDSTTKIWRFSASDGAYLGQHTLGARVRGAQGIAYRPNANAVYITSWVSPNSRINVYHADSFALLQVIDPSNIGSGDEIEGVICWQNKIYTHKINGRPLQLSENMAIPASLVTGDPAHFLSAAQMGDAGTVLMRWRPATLPSLQTVFDNQTNANTWESWCSSAGVLSWRITATTPRCDYTGIVAGNEYIIAQTWSKSGTTVEIKLAVNGLYRSTATQNWTAIPTGGLWLGGGNASNAQADAEFRDVLVFNKVLSDAEIADAYNGFSGFYDDVIPVTRAGSRLLRFRGGSSASAEHLTAPAFGQNASNFKIEFDILQRTVAAEYRPVFSNGQSETTLRNAFFFYGNSRAEVAFIIGGVRRLIELPTGVFSVGVRYGIEISYNGALLEFKVDGVTRGSVAATGSVNGLGITRFGLSVNEPSPLIDLYFFKYTENGILQRHYLNTTGTGSEWVNQVGGNNAVQQRSWPSDDSEWIGYNSITQTQPLTNLSAGVGVPTNINLDAYFSSATAYQLYSGALPAGLSIVGNQITGTATAAGTVNCVIRAYNDYDTLDSGVVSFVSAVMAYYLHYTPASGKYISIPVISVPTATDFSIEFEWFNLNTERAYPLAASTSGTNQIRIEPSATANNIILVNSGGVSYTFNFGSMVRSDFNLFKFTRVGNTISLEINGVPTGTPVSGSGVLNATFNFDRMFIRQATTAFAESGLKFLKYTQAGVLTRHYNASASGGTGGILSELISSQNGTQVGPWPSNDDEWISYTPAEPEEPVGDVSNITIGWPVPTVSVSQSSTVPQTTASVAFGWPVPAVGIAQSSTAPQTTASVAIGWPVPAVSVAQSSTAPQTTASVAIGWPLPAISVTHSSVVPQYPSTVAIGWPVPTVSAVQSSVVPQTTASIAFGWPVPAVSVSQSSTVPQHPSTIAIGWPAPVVGVSQSSELPQFPSDIAFGWPMPIIDVRSTSYSFTNSQRIDIPYLPAMVTSVDIPSQSRFLDIPTRG
jgi:hypothetical protein